jgi:hypothetical protein
VRRQAIILSTVLLLAACGGSSGPALGLGARSTSDVFELEVSFDGRWSRELGSSHEWYSPRTGFYRVEKGSKGRAFASVYDGSTITKRINGKIARIEGEGAMLRYIVARPNIFDSPGLVAIRAYLGGFGKPDLQVKPNDGGRSFSVDWHFVDEGIDTHVHYTVRVRSRMHLGAARSKGLLAPIDGPLAGELRQSPPGTRPHFGEQALWFGPKLPVGGRAVTVLESRGADVFVGGESAANIRYTTMYRLPRSAVPAGVPVRTAGTYPGLGDELPVDVRVDCVPESTRLGLLAMRGARSRITLANHIPATLYVGGPGGFAVRAAGTVCQIQSRGGMDRLRRFARELRPL